MKCKTCLNWNPNQRDEPKDENGETLRICWHPKMGGIRDDDFSCEYFLGEHDPSLNLPNHTPNGTMIEPNQNKADGPTEILIVTYGTPTMRPSGRVVSELDWLEYCLRSIKKHCSGFQGVTIAHPAHETEMFISFADRFKARLHGYDEIKGKGFLQHEAKMAEADLFLPSSTKYVLHVDADCCFKVETTPEHFFHDDKPIYLYRPYSSLIEEDKTNPGHKVIGDCYQWKQPTEEQLGFAVEQYTMTRHPTILPIEFYPKYRSHIESVHQKTFLQYHLEGRNEHPASRMDFTAFGAFAFNKMNHRFFWYNVALGSYPEDRLQAFWSHGGIDEKTRAQMEGYLK